MSVQILLQGKIHGTKEFLLAGAGDAMDFAGRANWVALLSEVLPRALIAEMNLSRMLLGSSGGEQFLVVLPSESRPQAESFLNAARSGMRQMSGGGLDLCWAITENLGDWTVVRKRLNDEMQRKLDTPLSGGFGNDAGEFQDLGDYFPAEMGEGIRDASQVGWSPESPARITLGAGKHVWSIGSGPAAGVDAIPMARHTALSDDGHHAATPVVLAARADGKPVWGVLRGDVDNFGIRIRRAQSIEEHVQLSVLYKQFFAGELEVLCSMPEFWRKVTLLYAGGDDFIVFGCWDALIGFARELQRLFHRFSEDHLKDFPGPDGKTISMALALAPDNEATLASIVERTGDRLELAKSTDKDCVYLLGRVLEWKQLSDAAEVREALVRMVQDFGAPPEFIRELCGIYRETKRAGPGGDRGHRRPDRPWRFHRRLNRILESSRARDYQKARTSLIAELVGKNPAHLKLRPSGRVALEWARLSTTGKTAEGQDR